MLRISVLVPFGADDSVNGKQRRKVWEHVQKHWVGITQRLYLPIEIIEGHDTLAGGLCAHAPFIEYPRCGRLPISTSGRTVYHSKPFSVSRALNDAARRATGDVYLLFGADHIPNPTALVWACRQLDWHPWQKIYDRIAYASQAATTAILAGFAVDSSEWTHHNWPCPGVLAIRANAWNFVGGMDETYEGYGYEDSDLFARLSKEFGHTPHASGEILHELWSGTTERPLYGTSNEAAYRAKWGNAHGL